MKKALDGILESFSLTSFLIYIHAIKMNTSQDWLAPYFMSSVMGVLACIYLINRGIILNRIFLGVTLYFLSGLFGLIVGWSWLNQLYGDLGAVAMLSWVLLVGVLSSFFSVYGFLGLIESKFFWRKTGSMLLLSTCFIATVMAWYFSGNKLLGEWIPFIILFSVRSILLRWRNKELVLHGTLSSR